MRRAPGGTATLPAVASHVEFVDGPWLPENGRVCLLHDTAARRWGATARLAATGLRLRSVLGCPGLLAGVGPVLAGQAEPGGIDRASVLIRTTGPAMQEAFLTVSAPGATLRRTAGVVDRGAQGRTATLYAALSALGPPLQSLGLDAPQWLDHANLVDALHPPGTSAPRVVRGGSGRAGPWRRTLRLAATDDGERGYDRVGVPARAGRGGVDGADGRGDDAGRRFVHDGYAGVSWVVLPADDGALPFDALPPLLAGPDHGQRLSLAVHYQAAHPVTARAPTGAGTSSPVRCGAVAAVTLPADGDLEAAADAVEAAASARLVLHRLDLAQDSGFVAATLPVGIGLDRLRVGR